jgi:hypothetical protein
MKNYIEHETFVDFYNKDEEIFNRLFNNIFSWNEFNKTLKKECKNYSKFGYTKEQGPEKMIGDLFEIFAELYFKILSADTRVGIYDYKPEPGSDDYGVDGIAFNLKGEKVAIQVKYRSDPTLELKGSDLKNFQGLSYATYGVPIEGKNLIIFTNCKGLHYVTEDKVMSNKTITFGYKEISSRVENNLAFWNICKEYINQTIFVNYGE